MGPHIPPPPPGASEAGGTVPCSTEGTGMGSMRATQGSIGTVEKFWKEPEEDSGIRKRVVSTI